MRTSRAAALLVSVPLLLAGCGSDGGGGDAVAARQTAGIHLIEQQAEAIPGVRCAQGGLATGGLPHAPLGALFVQVDFDSGVSPSRQEAIIREVGRKVWLSDLVITDLSVSTPGGASQLSRLLGAPVTLGPADLARAYGPRPARPTPLPALTDPGTSFC